MTAPRPVIWLSSTEPDLHEAHLLARYMANAPRRPACRCSHPHGSHATDRKGRPICRGSFVCGCGEYRPTGDVA